MLTAVNGYVVRALEDHLVMGLYLYLGTSARVDAHAGRHTLNIEPAKVWDGHLAVAVADIVGYGSQYGIDVHIGLGLGGTGLLGHQCSKLSSIHFAPPLLLLDQ